MNKRKYRDCLQFILSPRDSFCILFYINIIYLYLFIRELIQAAVRYHTFMW